MGVEVEINHEGNAKMTLLNSVMFNICRIANVEVTIYLYIPH